jgi:cell division protein ZipA
MWLTILMAIIIILAVFFILRRRRRKNHYQKEEPIFDDDGREETEKIQLEEIKEQPRTEPKISNQALIIMRLIASKDRPYSGYELLQALLSNGFRFGKMNIFHRHEQLNGEGPILFSLARATEPGTFDIYDMGSCTCSGLTIFMRIADHQEPMRVFETMLNTIKQLADDLGGEIWDERNLVLNQSVIDRWRSRIQTHIDSLYSYDLFDSASRAEIDS